jgi:hypothetical protein
VVDSAAVAAVVSAASAIIDFRNMVVPFSSDEERDCSSLIGIWRAPLNTCWPAQLCRKHTVTNTSGRTIPIIGHLHMAKLIASF